MYALLIVAWRMMLAGWGQRLDGWAAARIWTVSSLGKYLPGKVWAVAGMALMAQRAGIAPWAATGSAVVLQVLAIGTGAAVAGLTGRGRSRRRIRAQDRAGAAGRRVRGRGGAAAVAAGPPAPAPAHGARRRSPGAPPAAGISVRIVANLVAWLGYGSRSGSSREGCCRRSG